MDEFGFVEPVDGLCEGIVLAVADTANGGFNASLCQALGVADADVLRSAIRMMHKPGFAGWPSLMEGLLERVQDEAGMGSPADPPSHDAPRVGVDDEGYIDEPRPRRASSEVREP